MKGGEFKDDEGWGQVDNGDDDMGGHERYHVKKALPLDQKVRGGGGTRNCSGHFLAR